MVKRTMVKTSVPNNGVIENIILNIQENPIQAQVSELSKQAYILLKNNDIAGAIHNFNEILKLDTTNNYALVGLGDAERKKNKYNEAIKFYKQSLEYHDKNNYALFGLADCYKALKQFPEAIEIWEEYLKLDNTNITVLTRIADAYRKIKNFTRAEQLYLKVLEKDPKNAYALIGLGHLNYDFKHYREALLYWEKVVDTSEDMIDIRILTSIGNCYRKMRFFEKGIQYFQKSIEREPNNFYGLFGLADCYRGLNQHNNSIVYWYKILDLDPKNKVILTRIGDAYRNMGEYDKAKECYQNALDIAFDSYAMLGLAILCKIQKKYDEAIKSLSVLRNAEETNYKVYLELADCYIQKNNRQAAIDVLSEFQRKGIKNQLIANLLFTLTKNE